MRIVITGGGTGGHIYPALAVAESLKADPEVDSILYIGNRTSLERELVPQAGFAFESIVFHGMPRKPGVALLKWFWELGRAVGDAKALLIREKPDVVFGTGGYVSAPVLMAAKSLGIPYLIHEPDAHPGLVNRLMSRWADQVTAAFTESHAMLKGKRFTATGNPLRGKIHTLAGPDRIAKAEALRQLDLPWPADRPVLLVVGGSQGARSLNHAVIGALPVLIGEMGFRIIHQTGAKLYEEAMAEVPEAYRNHPDYCLRPFYPEMWQALAAADLAVCRAGSLTLSEMYLSGIPTVLVPYPFAAADHQRKNAMASVAAGASEMILDHDCTAERLVSVLKRLSGDPEKLNKMKAACRTLAHPEATDAITNAIKALAR